VELMSNNSGNLPLSSLPAFSGRWRNKN